MGGARAPLYAAWCPGPDLSGSSVRCLLGVEIMWRSRRDDACTTPSCEVTDAIAFAAFGAPGAGPRLECRKSVVPRRDDSRYVPRRYRPRTTYMRSVMTDLSPGRLPGSGSRLLDWRTVKTGQRNCGRVQLRVRWIPAVRCHGRCGAALCRPSRGPEPRRPRRCLSARRVVARAPPGRRMRNANSDRDSLTGAAARDQDKTTGVTTPHTLEPKMAARPSAHCTLLLFWLPVATGNALRVRGLHPVP